MTQTRVWTLGSLAEQIDARLEGDSQCRIRSLNTLQKAGPHELTFLANPSYEKYLAQTSAAAVILKSAQAPAFSGNKLVVDNPYLAFAHLTRLFETRSRPEPGVHPTAWVHPQASLAAGVSIGPNASIEAGVELAEGVIIGAGCSLGEGCRIGANSRLFANVTLYHGVTLGSQVTLHSGCVIGADGFGFAPSREGWVKVHQLGGVTIGDRVDIGAGTTIDRGALDDTVIGNGVIIDNQVQIAHNVRIGENTAIAGCAGIAGSTSIGKNCTIAGAASIAGHLQLVDGVHISARTLVTKSISEPGSYSSGTVMAPTQTWRRNVVRFGQLDRMASRLTALEKLVASQIEDKQ